MALPVLVALAGCAAGPADAAAPEIGVPDYVGKVLKDAKESAQRTGFRVKSHDATEGESSQWADGNWRVCFQSPAAGARVVPSRTTLDLAVVRIGARCPKADGQAPPVPKAPNVVGRTFTAASTALRKVGVTEATPESAYIDVQLPAAPGAWRVCFQDPKAGEPVGDAGSASATLSLVRPGTRCPKSPNAELRRKPVVPKPRKSDEGSNGGGSAYYRNCSAARAAGAAPLRRGDPGYSRRLDRDGDGVACE